MSLLAAAVTFVTGLGPAMSEPAKPAGGIAATGNAALLSAKAAEKAGTALEFDSIGGLDGSKVPEAAGRPIPPFTAPPARMAQIAAPLGQGYVGETEPNGTSATATPLASTNTVVRANLFPNGDQDFFSFTANAGDRVYAAVMTSFSAGSSTDSQLTLLASDGTTTIEFDDDNGSFAALSSSIAGATIPTTGTYYLKVNDFTAGTTSERGYELHLRVQSGAPTPEVEANDTPAQANPLPANGWVSGVRNPAVATEQDWYSMSLNAGDTVYLSLDVNPERDGTVWNGRLGIALFGDGGNQILVVDDAGTGDVTPVPNNPSEALFMTVKDAGTYFAFVDSASAAVGGPTATYQLSVSIRPAVDEGVNCTTYTSTNVPQAIGPGTGLVSSTITVPGNPRVADVDVQIQLNHALMQDIDANLRSPAGQDFNLFTDIGAAATGGQTQMDLWFDDEAGVTPAFTVLRGMRYKPENTSTGGTASTSGASRLGWFDGTNGGGTWTLDLRDDTAGANGGTLTGWALRICEAPPPPTCAAGFTTTTVYSTDFEAGDAGFTHTGAQDEWARGTPNTPATTTANPVAAFTTCNSGTSCWKTDLTGTYNASSNQDLLSPNINLAGLQPPVVVTWAQRHQVESANFDRYFVDFQQVGGANPIRLYDWTEPTPISASAGTGNPQVNIGSAVGWSVLSRRADALAGQNSELRFNVTSDTSVQFGGVAVDDVTVTACRALSADLSITKTDGVANAVPGGSVTYTITASNAGPDPVSPVTVADTFPAALSCTWTCVGAGGGTCTAAGAGNINDATVNLPSGGSVTYTASCAVSAAATGILSNTATIAGGIVTDPNPGNNSATDTDTLTPQADLAITKTDGVAQVSAGGSTTYTIVASNAGPSNAPGSTLADTFPAACTSVNWTCTGAAGGTCTAAGSGNINDTVNLPAGGSVTYTAACAISASASGTLANTATITAAGGVTDPTGANNSATDTNTVVQQADLSITKTNGVTQVLAGSNSVYTIVASNAGPSSASGSTVADTFPAACTSATWTCVGAAGGTCTAAGSGNINDTVNLPVGASVTYTATCAVNAAAVGTLANTATVAVAAGVTDPTGGNNSATDSDTIVAAQADVSITKTDGQTSDTPGTTISYTIVASNAGPGAASSVAVADTLPAALTGANWTCVGAGGGTCTAAGSGNINDTANLPSGASVTYTLNATIAAAATGTLSNTATATVSAPTTDPNPANNSATDTTTLTANADLQIALSSSVPQVLANVPVTFIATSLNAGPSDAQDVSITLTLSPDLRYSSHTATGATCTTPQVGNSGVITCTWAGATAPGVVRTLEVTAYSNTEGTSSVNASTASPTNDPVANNNATAVSVVVGFPFNEIPSLGQWGLLLLGLMLAGVGLVAVRRQS